LGWYLVEQASYLTKVRQQYVDFLNQHQKVDSKKFKIDYLKNEFSWQGLKKAEELEKRIKRTVIGPQKDDYAISLIQGKRTKNLHHYGSRSEQRLAVFWLKLNEIKFLENSLKSAPILLLDDVFSELDLKNKKLILDLIEKYQTIITTTEENLPELTQVEKKIIEI
jgi:DNA replication and repair protein RecF